MSASAISSLIGSLEGFLVDVFDSVGDFVESAIAELVNYAPTLVDIAVIGTVAVGLGYAFRSALVNIPFIGPLITGLGKILHI